MAANTANLLTAHHFTVDIAVDRTTISAGFKSVKGLKRVMAFEPLMVGGKNDGPVLLPIPAREAGRLTLERGKYAKAPLRALQPGKRITSMTITVMDREGNASTAYIVVSPVVESIETGGLDALTSETLIESFTVLFSSLEEWEA